MRLSTHSYRPMLAMAVIAASASGIATAQYKFVNINIPGAVATTAAGISNRNEIVGYYQTGTTYAPVYHGFWRTNDHPAILQYPVDDPNGTGFSELHSIDSGRVAVGAYSAASNILVGFFLSGTYTNVNVPGYSWVSVNGINDPGEMVGSCISNNGNQAWREILPNAAEILQIPGGNGAVANAVNSAGAIVGGYRDTTYEVEHGFLLDAQNNFTVIDYPGALETWATGISDTGVIAGTYYDGTGGYLGFLLENGVYTSIEVPYQINTELGQINKHGWFVGSYTNAHGKTVGFYAKPSAAASVLVDTDE